MVRRPKYVPNLYRGGEDSENLRRYTEAELLAISRTLTETEAGGFNPIVFDVRDYLNFSSSADRTLSIRAARSDAEDAGGGIVWLPPGEDWILTDASPETGPSGNPCGCVVGSNIWLDGGGVVDVHGTTNDFSAFGCQGGSSFSSTLSAATAINTNTSTFTSVTGLVDDDYVEFAGNDSNGDFHFCVNRVFSINTGTKVVTFYDVFTWDWASGAAVSVSTYVRGGGFRNLLFKGSSALELNVNAIRDHKVMERTYHNLRFEGWSGSDPATGISGGLVSFGGYLNSATKVYGSRGGSAGGDDITFSWQMHLSGDEIRVRDPQGFGVGFHFCTAAQVGRVSCRSKATSSNFSRQIKIAGGIGSTYQSFHVTDGKSTGVAVSNATNNCSVAEIYARGCPTTSVGAGGAVGVWHSDERNRGNSYGIVDSQNWRDLDMAFFATDTGNRVSDARIGTLTNLGNAKIGGVSGTFTATLKGGTSDPTLTYTFAGGTYWTAPGGHIYGDCFIGINAISAAGSGDILADLTNIPFSGTMLPSTGYTSGVNWGANTFIMFNPGPANNQCTVKAAQSNAANATLQLSALANGDVLYFGFHIVQ